MTAAAILMALTPFQEWKNGLLSMDRDPETVRIKRSWDRFPSNGIRRAGIT